MIAKPRIFPLGFFPATSIEILDFNFSQNFLSRNVVAYILLQKKTKTKQNSNNNNKKKNSNNNKTPHKLNSLHRSSTGKLCLPQLADEEHEKPTTIYMIKEFLCQSKKQGSDNADF